MERAYVLKHTPEDKLLPSTVTAENLTLTDNDSGEEIEILSVSYYKDDNSVLIYPQSLSGGTEFLLSSTGLKKSNGDAASIAGVLLVPLIKSDADIYDASVLYSEYTVDGKFVYDIAGRRIFDAVFTIVNASDTDYIGLGYTISPKSSPETVLKTGSIDISAGGYATIEASFNSYVMQKNDDLIVTFEK